MGRLALGATAVTAALTLVLAACSSSGPVDEVSSGSASVPSETTVTESPSGHNDEHGEYPTPGEAPTWDGQSEASAVETATAAMTAFARPSVSYPVWWRDLRPFLSESARHAYSHTDPASVPAGEVSETGRLVDAETPYLAGVDVPTDVGTYRVLLSRQAQDDPWRVERFTPPGAASDPGEGAAA